MTLGISFSSSWSAKAAAARFASSARSGSWSAWGNSARRDRVRAHQRLGLNLEDNADVLAFAIGRPRCRVLGKVLTLGTIGTRLRPVIRKRSCDMGQCSCVHSGAVANTTKWHRSMKPARR